MIKESDEFEMEKNISISTKMISEFPWRCSKNILKNSL